MSASEDRKKAEDAERARAKQRDPGTLYTIAGKMEHQRWLADHPEPKPTTWIASTPTFYTPPVIPKVEPVFKPNVPSTYPLPKADPPPPHVDDWTDRAMQRIPYWLLGVCAILGAIVGFAIGAASGGPIAIVYALVGFAVGLLALPGAIKLAQLTLRVLAVAAVVLVFLFVFWVLAHSH